MLNGINDKNKIINWGLASGISTGGGYLALKYCPEIDKKIFYLEPSKVFKLTENEKDLFLKKAQETIDSSELKNSQIKIQLIDENTKLDKSLAKKLKDVKYKKNAAFFPSKNTIFVNRDFLSPIFHELGHAENYRRGSGVILLKLSKALTAKQIMLGIPLAAILLNKKKKPNGKKYNNIRENIGIIAGTALLPNLIEETTASINGYKMAKKAGINDNLMKIINKTHAWGLSSYCRYMAYYMILVTGAIKSKDYLQEKIPQIREKYSKAVTFNKKISV